MKKQIVVALVAALSAAASSVAMADQFTMNQYSNDNWYAGSGIGTGHSSSSDFGWTVNGGYNFASFNNVQLAADAAYLAFGHGADAWALSAKGTYDFANSSFNTFGKIGLADLHHGDNVSNANNGAALALGAGVGYEIAQIKGLEATVALDYIVAKSPSAYLLSAGVNYQF